LTKSEIFQNSPLNEEKSYEPYITDVEVDECAEVEEQ